METHRGAPCFRLRGEADGDSLSFVLAAGEHTLGTDPAGDVVVPVRGVSRRHAVLQVSAAGVQVVDLGSKNGSFVNGRDGQNQLALVGDELRFGPVRLHLDVADPEDAVLGLHLDPESGLLQPAPSLETTWLRRPDDTSAAPDLLEAALDALLRAEPDLAAALDEVRRDVGAAGIALLRWPGDAAVVVASAGQLGPPPDRPAPSPRWRRGPVAGGELVWRRVGELAEGLILWGEISRSGRSELVAVARLLQHFAPGVSDVGGDGGGSGEPKPLRLPPDIVRGHSPAMERLYRQMSSLVSSDVPVLILGETGVGKEHLARTLHASGSRSGGPFVPVNCAAIPKELLEAEMFGIAKGVATGVDARRGRFSEARGGTLFLDEIGDMPMELQAKLLRVLQDGEIHPLGRAAEKTDVRIVAATNTHLHESIARRTFRSDLYYRLAGYVLDVPPLRRRTDDIPLLVAHFLRRMSREAGKPIRGVTVKALRGLAAAPWPGNVRELEHEVRRLVFACRPHHVIDAEMLTRSAVSAEPTEDAVGPSTVVPSSATPSSAISSTETPSTETPSTAAPSGTAPSGTVPSSREATSTGEPGELPAEGLEALLRDVEARAIRDALRRTAGNQSAAARLLRISRNGLGKRIKRLGIDVARFLPENR